MTSQYAFRPDLEETSEVAMGTTRSGLEQLRRTWHAPDPRAAALIVHGIAEHSGRYEHVARQLVAAGITVVGFDQRCHGHSAGRTIRSFDQFHDDVEDHLTEIMKLGLPTVVLGHSMGGLVAASYVLADRPPADLVVLSAPALAFAPPRWSWGPIAGIGRRLGTVPMSIPIKPEQLATDTRVGEVYMADPYVRLGQSVGLVGAMAAAASDVERLLPTWQAKAMIVHGLDDRIVPASVGDALAEMPSVERRTYEGLRHELFNEPKGPQVVADVLGWIDGSL